MEFGTFDLNIIRECEFKLDGGAMFGVVPKSLWGKMAKPDEHNRIPLACNLLLIETPDGRVLVETGMGSRWSDKERERFELRSLLDPLDPLSSVGLCPDEIDYVLISHMHFDHLGGAVMLSPEGNLAPTFPNAKVVVQRGEYELAHKVNSRGRASYRKEDWQTLEAMGLLEIVDGDTEIVPGVWLRVTGGHTSHHQIITFESEGHKGVFFADIVPTQTHLSPPWVMGYDHHPLETCDVKDEWLTRASQENWLVVFDHEIGTPWGHVQQKSAGKFDFVPLVSSAVTA